MREKTTLLFFSSLLFSSYILHFYIPFSSNKVRLRLHTTTTGNKGTKPDTRQLFYDTLLQRLNRLTIVVLSRL